VLSVAGAASAVDYGLVSSDALLVSLLFHVYSRFVATCKK
jgi:hypothetical protein